MRNIVAGWGVLMIALLASCGETEHPVATDSVVPVVASDSGAYLAAKNSVSTLTLPALIEPDSFAEFAAYRIDEATANELLPGFEYSNYHSVECVAHSKIRNIPLLWFRLESDGFYEESPALVEILVVMYDCNYQPIDVYNAAYSDIDYTYSYMTNDSIFTVNHAEMEDINITTTVLAIKETGFMPEPSVSRTFPGNQQGSDDGSAYCKNFIQQHRR